MKGYTILTFLFFSNLLLMNYLHSFTNIDIITFYWYEITLLSILSKLICYYSDSNFYYYTMLLVNKNQTIWNSDHSNIMLLPSHFLFLLLTEYCANADREYIFVVNNWCKIMLDKINILISIILFYYNYNIFTIIIILSQLVSVYNKKYIIILICSYIYNFKFIFLSQLIESCYYMYNYNKEMKSNGVNNKLEVFASDTTLLKRPMMSLNLFYIIIPLYNIVFC
jgi:hypothetical protein